MGTVSVNAPKTPVTKGSNGIAAATVPNVCKMPGPPAPFVPTPLPNIGKSSDSTQGYSTTTEIEGQPVAIMGASFGSMGDVASKGTGGGIVSQNVEGQTTFIGPGSLDVQIEGKNVHLLGDPMLNNNGPGGSPPNAATMMGVLQGPLPAVANALGVLKEVQHICDIKCMCQKKGQGDACITAVLWAEDAAVGYRSPLKAQTPYNMNPPGGGPPTPYMSTGKYRHPRRATRNWYIPNHRRPDVTIVGNVDQPWSGKNIRAVVELKLKNDPWRKGQKQAYRDISGDRLLEMNDENCICLPDPTNVVDPAQERKNEQSKPEEKPEDELAKRRAQKAKPREEVEDEEPKKAAREWAMPDWVVPLAVFAVAAAGLAVAVGTFGLGAPEAALASAVIIGGLVGAKSEGTQNEI